MTRKTLTVEHEMRGRIETISNQIENFTAEAVHQREAAALNDELVERLNALRDGYVRLLGSSEFTK